MARSTGVICGSCRFRLQGTGSKSSYRDHDHDHFSQLRFGFALSAIDSTSLHLPIHLVFASDTNSFLTQIGRSLSSTLPSDLTHRQFVCKHLKLSTTFPSQNPPRAFSLSYFLISLYFHLTTIASSDPRSEKLGPIFDTSKSYPQYIQQKVQNGSTIDTHNAHALPLVALQPAPNYFNLERLRVPMSIRPSQAATSPLHHIEARKHIERVRIRGFPGKHLSVHKSTFKNSNSEKSK